MASEESTHVVPAFTGTTSLVLLHGLREASTAAVGHAQVFG